MECKSWIGFGPFNSTDGIKWCCVQFWIQFEGTEKDLRNTIQSTFRYVFVISFFISAWNWPWFRYAGEKNILSIAPSNATMLNNLTSAKISLYNDKLDNQTAISFELDLTRIANGDNDSDDIYVTQPFEPPRQPFKIDVSQNDNPIYGWQPITLEPG